MISHPSADIAPTQLQLERFVTHVKPPSLEVYICAPAIIQVEPSAEQAMLLPLILFVIQLAPSFLEI